MKDILKLIRPQQWLKNLFVFIPVFFGGALFNIQDLWSSAITAVSFCLAASSIYCFNDIQDAEDDRRHPVKCHRPIASGAISVRHAYEMMFLMFFFSLFILLLLPYYRLQTGVVILFYWFMNLAYCAKLKQYAIIDVCVVAFGFVLRLLAGGNAAGIELSKWIVLMTFLITLFMSFAKRRDDVIRMKKTGEAPRKNTSRYNLTFINQAITITASVTLVCYIMYTVSPEVMMHFHTGHLYLTSVFVLLGLLRYIQITVVDEKSGDPTQILLRDHFIQLDIIAWLAAFLLIIYFG